MLKRNGFTDEQVLACVAPTNAVYGNATYVVRNRLAAPPHGFGRNVETPAVLRRLKRLERQGKVERTYTSYVVMICWRRVEEPARG